ELIRSTLLSALSLPRRQRLEARVAKAIEALHDGTSLKAHAAAIAHHLFEAGPAAGGEQTPPFLILASDQAVETGALSSGLDWIERALSLVHDDSPVRITLLWKRGLSRRGLGQLMQAIEDWETALRLCDIGTDQSTVTALCQELAHSYAW